MRSTQKTILSGAVSIMAISALSPLQAQQAENDVIVVTGEKRTRSLQETNASVAVFDAEALSEQNLLNVADALELTAGVVTTQEGRSVSIRGANATFNQTVDAGIVINAPLSSLVVDGLEVPGYMLQGGPTRAWDVQQVEVFRGPQSTVLGRNTLSGAIVVRTADPEFEYGAKAQLQVAELGLRQYAGMVNVPFSDEFAVRIAAEYFEEDGDISNEFLGTDDQDFQESLTLRAKALYAPEGSPFSALLTLNYVEAEEGFGGVFDADNRCNTIGPDVNPCVPDPDPFLRQGWNNTPVTDDREQHTAILELNYELNDAWSLRSITGYSYSELTGQKDDDNAFLLEEVGLRIRDETILSQEFRANYQSEKLSGVMGAFLYRSEFFLQNLGELEDVFLTQDGFPFGAPPQFQLIPSAEAAFYANPAVGLPPALVPALVDATPASLQIDFGNDNEYVNTNYALFADFDYDFAPSWTLTFGARVDYQSYEYDVFNAFGRLNQPQVEAYLADVTAVLENAPGFPEAAVAPTVAALEQNYVRAVESNILPLLGSTQDRSDDGSNTVFLPKLGLTKDLTDDISVAFTVQRGYRTGGISYEPAGQGRFEQYNPEFTWNYELAFRTAWLNDRLFVNANIYYIDWTDQQVLFIEDVSDPFSGITVNAGESFMQGAEIEVVAAPVDGLTLSASAAYNDTEFEEYIFAGNDLSGNDFALAPEWTAAARASYEHSSGFFISANASYVGDRFQFERNENLLGSYIVASAQAGYQHERFRAAIFVNNLFDEEYLTQNRSDIFSTVGDPRVVGGSLTIEY